MLQVKLLRIDSRLLHGQVATNWVRVLKIDRIIVASNRVAGDSIRKNLIQQASPPGVQTYVVPLTKLIMINHNYQFSGQRILLLVETPQDAMELVANGIQVSRINVGSLSFNHSKQMISEAVAVNNADIQAFAWLHDHQIQLEIRKVSSDAPKDLWQILVNKHLAM